MISVVATADLHLGPQKYGVLNTKTGLDSSLENTLRCLDHLVYYSIKHKVGVVLINGDLSKRKTLSEDERSELYHRIKQLNDANIEVILIKGNHDGSTGSKSTFNVRSLKVLDLKHVHVVDEPTLIRREDCFIIAMPYMNSIETWVEEYKLLRKKIWGTKKKIIVALHGNVQGVSHYASELLESDEPNDIPLKLFKNDDSILAVACGHQHEHQVLLEKPYVFYSGSLDRVTFAERKQPKGFVHFRLVDGKLKKSFIEVEAKKFIQISVAGKAIPKRDYKKAVVKVIVDNLSDEVGFFDMDYIEQKLKEMGAEIVIIKRKMIDKGDVKRFNVSSTGFSFKKRISMWVKENVPERIQSLVKEMGLNILEEVQEIK